MAGAARLQGGRAGLTGGAVLLRPGYRPAQDAASTNPETPVATDDRKPDRGPHDAGQTIPMQGETQERVPRMPHERDESADSQAPGDPLSQRRGEMAYDDLREGQVDTDKGPVLDATYEPMRQDDEPGGQAGGKPRP